MRLSSIQKDILFVLYGLMLRKHNSRIIPSVDLFRIVNNGRSHLIADTNFRRSCHTLISNGLMIKYRDHQSLKLAYDLTDKGKIIGREIYLLRVVFEVVN